MSANSSMGLAGTLAADTQGLDQLRNQAKHTPDKAIAGAAKQFEAMFLGMIMKSMREATPKDGLFDSEQTKMYTAMLDQQFSQQMASRGTGLADVITRQLSRGAMTPEAVAAAAGGVNTTLAAGAGANTTLAAGAGANTSLAGAANVNTSLSGGSAVNTRSNAGASTGSALEHSAALQMSTLALAKLNLDMQKMATAPATPAAPDFDVQPLSLDDEAWHGPHTVTPTYNLPQPNAATADAAPAGAATLAQTGGFVNRIWNHAVEAARTLGVAPQFMVGQAALESGWGKHEIRNADGSGTHNLFGVKAGKGWSGPTVDKTTTEFVNGVAQKTTAKFRVYASYGEAFKDYAKLIGGNPRYAGVVAQGQDARGFARGLQQAGYATDPAYADKLVRVINGTTLRQSLAYAPPVPAQTQLLARR
jgi:flagellar protein FlgJ